MILSTTDITGEASDRTARVKISKAGSDNAIFVEVEGMENEHGNPLLAIDMHEGKLRLFAWGKRDGEEYTHVLNLDTGKLEEVHE